MKEAVDTTDEDSKIVIAAAQAIIMFRERHGVDFGIHTNPDGSNELYIIKGDTAVCLGTYEPETDMTDIVRH